MITSEPHFYQTGGTLGPQSPSYVERQADTDLYDGLIRGEFCYVLTSRQMGKSSLMVRTAARLREEGVAVAGLDLTAIGQNLTPEQWYDGLLGLLGRGLDLEDELEAFWLAHERLGPLQRWMAAVREVVLARCGGRVVIFVDEIDCVRSLPFSSDEFFAAIRECYNRRSEDPEFARLTFCLLGVATPSDLIQDTRTTPFNIGRCIHLCDFTEAEAMPLAQGLGREKETGRALLRRILFWTGGHPHLTQRLCQAVADDGSVKTTAGVDRPCEELFMSPRARERDDNLLFVRERILQSEVDVASLLELYLQVRSGKRLRDSETNRLVSVLQLSGIVRVDNGYLLVRNRIYHQVFNQEWVLANMPATREVRHQQTAPRSEARWASLEVQASLRGWEHLSQRQAERGIQLLMEEEDSTGLLHVLQACRSGNTIPEAGEARAALWSAWHSVCAGRLVQVVGHEAPVVAVKFSPDATLLATASRDGTAQLWSVATGHPHGLPLQHQGPVSAVGFHPSGKLVATASADGTARLWSVEAGQPFGRQLPHPTEVSAVVFSPDGRTLATGAHDGAVRFWTATSGQPYGQPFRNESPISALAFSPNGRLLAAGSGDTVRLWDVGAKQMLPLFFSHAGGIQGVAFSRNGKLVATAGGNRTAQLWELPQGQSYGQPVLYEGGFEAIDFLPDGTFFGTACSDGTVRLWDTATRRASGRPVRHQGPVHALAFRPDGRLMATASSDSTARLWHLPALISLREMELRTWVALGARMNAHGDVEPLPWREWRRFWEELQRLPGKQTE